MAPSKKTSFTYELDNDQQELLLGVMLNGNYRKREVPYSLWSIEGDHFNATLYEKEKHGKRKLCVQGSKAEDFVLYTLEPRVLGGASLGYETVLNPDLVAPHAGGDESGKGDYFGPLVVCCAYTDEKLSAQMQELGVKDCKQMSDKAVLAAGSALRRLLGDGGYAVVKLGPAAYNRLYAKMRNINRMLAWAPATAVRADRGDDRARAQAARARGEGGAAPQGRGRHCRRRGVGHRARNLPSGHHEDGRGAFRSAVGRARECAGGLVRPARRRAGGADGGEGGPGLADEPLQGPFPHHRQGARRLRQIARRPAARGPGGIFGDADT